MRNIHIARHTENHTSKEKGLGIMMGRIDTLGRWYLYHAVLSQPQHSLPHLKPGPEHA